MLVLATVRSSSRSFVAPSEDVGGRVETASRLASLVVFPEVELFGEPCDNFRTNCGSQCSEPDLPTCV